MNRMYQVSVLRALLLGYTKGVITVKQLESKGTIGLGTFADVNGEMIVLDGIVYRANNRGEIERPDADEMVPFAAVAEVAEVKEADLVDICSIDQLIQVLNSAIDDEFGLNSMYVVRIDGMFEKVMARSEAGKRTQHVLLSEILEGNQREFVFQNVSGTLVCLYYPDYMDGINLPGWHMHFISEDRKYGGHVFGVEIKRAHAERSQIHQVEIRIPSDKAFDTYSLKSLDSEEADKVEKPRSNG